MELTYTNTVLLHNYDYKYYIIFNMIINIAPHPKSNFFYLPLYII